MKISKDRRYREAAMKLINIREQLGYSRQRMANFLVISKAAYCKNENGETFPGISTLVRLATTRDISLDWFLLDKGPKYFKEKEKLEVLEKRAEELQKELETEREAMHEMQLETERLQGREKELEMLDIKPETKELIEHMKKIPLLYHEIMVHFHRFKIENKELVETSLEPAAG